MNCEEVSRLLLVCILELGLFTLKKEFPPEMALVWRTTYLDKHIRIFQALKTGRIEKEVVFYTLDKDAL